MSEAAERPEEPQGAEEPRDTGRSRADDSSTAGASETGAPEESAPYAGAWADACAEDLAAERARRRRQYGPPPGSAAEELRRLLDAVTERISGLSEGAAPLFGAAAQGAAQHLVQQVVRQARAVVEPVVERNPEVFDHLAAAGGELLAAYRSAVLAQERRWTGGEPAAPTEDRSETAQDRPASGATEPRADQPDRRDGDTGDGRPGEGPASGEHIDLD